MWIVLETKAAAKALDHAPEEIQRSYDAWLQIVRLQGPAGLRLVKGFRDEALAGGWRGFRSSRLNRIWRVIYRVASGRVTIEVMDVNAHDYRR
jgi:addiction module RelE/StbE family toxin